MRAAAAGGAQAPGARSSARAGVGVGGRRRAEYKEVDLKGFMAIMPRKRTPITKDAVRQALETLEKYNGTVTKDGLKHLVKNVG